jgi:uncharacterized membrane protein YqjE
MIDRLSTTAAIAVRQAGAYTDLILSDLDVSSRLVRRRVSWAALALLSVHTAAVLGCTLIVAMTWDTPYRLWVIAGLFLGFVVVAATSVWRLGVVDAGAPGVLAQTAREWAKDRRVLEELLAQQRAQAR